MEPRSISRKGFIKRSSMLLAAGTGMLNASEAIAEERAEPLKADKSFTLKNVRLETGFEYDEDGEVVHTKTELFNIDIQDGKIKAIQPNKRDANAIDGKGLIPPSGSWLHFLSMVSITLSRRI
jgi:hypothetical protein